MISEIAVHTVKTSGIGMDEFYNYSTTITFSNDYDDAGGSRKRWKKWIQITRGYNKDHQPDLKQILWTLTVSSNYSVLVHYMDKGGNTHDFDTHIAKWHAICSIAATHDFIYVANSKLCMQENMNNISHHHGKFTTVLPRTRSHANWLLEYSKDHEKPWNEARTLISGGEKVEFMVFDSPIPSSVGYRIVLVWSS